MDPAIQHLFEGLHSKCPAFPVDADKLTFLYDPNEFYVELNKLILRSKKRVIIAALYLGTDEQCTALVQSLQQALKASPTLEVRLLFDRMRATREVPISTTATTSAASGSNGCVSSSSSSSSSSNNSSTGSSNDSCTRSQASPAQSPLNSSVSEFSLDSLALSSGTGRSVPTGNNSLYMLLPLMHTEYKDRVKIYLYQTPLLTSWFRTFVRSPRTQEVAGVQHLKVFIGDDELILSGANLEKNYFTERQDRYVCFRDCKDLVNWYDKLVRAVSTFSYSADLTSNCPPSPPSSFPRDLFPAMSGSDFTASVNGRNIILNPPPCGYDPLSEPYQFNQYAHEVLQPLLNPQPEPSVNSRDKFPFHDTWIFPTVQMGSAGVVHDEEVTKYILTECSKSQDDALSLSSPYFNITDCYATPLLSSSSKSTIDVITAHPTANGFFTAKDVSRHIPSLYLIASRWFMEKVTSAGHLHRIKLFEYQRSHWTYHAKGLWWVHETPSKTSLTMIGSPNFGYRSIHRDLESQVVILSQNASLLTALQTERNQLFRFAERIVDPRGRFQQPDLTNIPLWVKCFAPLAQKWL